MDSPSRFDDSVDVNSASFREALKQNNIFVLSPGRPTPRRNDNARQLNKRMKSLSLSVKKKGNIQPQKLKQKRETSMQANVKSLLDTGVQLIKIIGPVIKGKRQEAWEYFANLIKNGENVCPNHIVCLKCFEKGSSTYYKKTTSLSTLKTHLENVHQIYEKNPRMKNVKEIVNGESFSDGPMMNRDELVTRTSLMFIMTSTAFHVASNPYFQEWLLKMKVINSVEDAPSERALSDTGLERLYTQVRSDMSVQLNCSPDYLCAIFDCWMDTSKRHFFAIIIRFVDSEFFQKEFVLAFKSLEYKTADEESDIFEKSLREYEISEKKFIAISDKGSDMMKLSRIRNMSRLDCIAHGIHNLINADVIPKTDLIKALLKKLRAVLATFRYRTNDLKIDLKLDLDAEKAKWLNNICQLDQRVQEEDEFQRDIHVPPNSRPTTLKKDVVTRWFSIYEMLKSFQSQIQNVNRWLGYLNRIDLTITSTEMIVLPQLVTFFETFMLVTKILESDTSTINLIIIILVDLKSKLIERMESIKDTSCAILYEIYNMYGNTIDNIDSRFKISDEMITGTLIDPTFQHCEYVNSLLQSKGYTKKEFLKNMYIKYVGRIPENDVAPLSKQSSLRNQLAFKHGLLSTFNSFDKEVDAFDSINADQVEDLLSWWKYIGRNQFPLISKLAQIILSLSATAATIERLNSRAGKVLIPARASLSNSKCHKVMSVLYNYPAINSYKKK